jgi:NADH-quinone oxidoreductase subunit F
VKAIGAGRGEADDMKVMDDFGKYLAHTFCAFAPGAQGPFLSAIEKFRGEFEDHIKARRVA